MKAERPAAIDITAQEDGTVLMTLLLTQTIQWIPRGPGEFGSAIKPIEPPTKILKFILPAYDAQYIGSQLNHYASEAIHMAKMREFNSKASKATKQPELYQE